MESMSTRRQGTAFAALLDSGRVLTTITERLDQADRPDHDQEEAADRADREDLRGVSRSSAVIAGSVWNVVEPDAVSDREHHRTRNDHCHVSEERLAPRWPNWRLIPSAL